ncbi:MAG TPA: DUF1501 domain-containing protein, partial [Polyangiaceae bacterium]|nr:DUF1501 domain-containing protein [Polyangiaceae bacterium]
MLSLSRRNVLRAGSALLASAALPQLADTAQAAAPARNLIVVLNSGGWDNTYALDPKPGATRIDVPGGEVKRFGRIDVLSQAARPSVDRFFERYGALTALIRGVQVRSFIHNDCTKRILTGTPSDQNADFAAIAAHELGRELPVPYLVLGNSALSGPYAALTGRAGTTNQISSLLNPDGFFITGAPYAPSDQEEALVSRYLRASADRLSRTRGRSAANRKQIEAFTRSLEQSALLRDFARTRGGFGDQAYTPDLRVQIDVATKALEGGLCHAAMLETSGWDTHNDNTEQNALHETLFANLLLLAQTLEQKALLSRTVVVVLSEMGRTPKLNAGGGKDHWPVTSALVFGAGVRGDN